LTFLLRRMIRDHLRRARPEKILNVFQRIRLRFFRACGLASGRTSFASSRMAMPDRLLACMIHKRIYCNRGFAALAREASPMRETSFVKRISFRSRTLHVSRLLSALHASRDTLHSLLRLTRIALLGDCVTNRHEECGHGSFLPVGHATPVCLTLLPARCYIPLSVLDGSRARLRCLCLSHKEKFGWTGRSSIGRTRKST
jgi:hypothetical protein